MIGFGYILMTLLLTVVRARSLSREIVDLVKRIDERYGIDSIEHDEFFKLLGFEYDFDARNGEGALTRNEEPNNVDSKVKKNIVNKGNRYEDSLLFHGYNIKSSKSLKGEKSYDLREGEDDRGKEKEKYKQSIYQSNLLSQLYNSDETNVNVKKKAYKIVPEDRKLHLNRIGNVNKHLQEIKSSNDLFEGNPPNKFNINIEYSNDYDSRDYYVDTAEEYRFDSKNDEKEGINYREEYDDNIKRDYIEDTDEEDVLLSALEDVDNDNEEEIDYYFGVIDYLESIKMKGERAERNRQLYEDLSDEDHAVMDYIPDEDYQISESEE